VLDDRMVLTIAGQACLLVLMQDGEPYPKLRSVLIYPSAYRARDRFVDEAGVVHEREMVRLGESWSNGTVVLAWDAVRQGAQNCFDGHNVTVHEFAHQLDQANGRSDGIPRLPDVARYTRWTQVLATQRAELDRMAEAGRRTVLDTYGTTNAAEFFAVATEAFFEKPRQLNRKQPELYALLKAYYQLDPVEWFTQG
jgi:Mlc titration factor MtfA (ptsG expression regulator)